jgi:hypothetical protein
VLPRIASRPVDAVASERMIVAGIQFRHPVVAVPFAVTVRPRCRERPCFR